MYSLIKRVISNDSHQFFYNLKIDQRNFCEKHRLYFLDYCVKKDSKKCLNTIRELYFSNLYYNVYIILESGYRYIERIYGNIVAKEILLYIYMKAFEFKKSDLLIDVYLNHKMSESQLINLLLYPFIIDMDHYYSLDFAIDLLENRVGIKIDDMKKYVDVHHSFLMMYKVWEQYNYKQSYEDNFEYMIGYF